MLHSSTRLLVMGTWSDHLGDRSDLGSGSARSAPFDSHSDVRGLSADDTVVVVAMVGDLVCAIDGRVTRGMTIDAVVHRIRGSDPIPRPAVTESPLASCFSGL